MNTPCRSQQSKQVFGEFSTNRLALMIERSTIDIIRKQSSASSLSSSQPQSGRCIKRGIPLCKESFFWEIREEVPKETVSHITNGNSECPMFTTWQTSAEPINKWVLVKMGLG